MILFNLKYDIEVERFEKDNCGRLVILDTKINGSNLILVNVYTPNEIAQQVQFFEKIKNKLSSYTDENILIGGDFNCPLMAFDKIGGRPVENKKTVIDKISNLLSIYSLYDIWHEKNISKKEFTWRDKAYKVQCRLYYFLTTPNLTKLTRNCNIIHAPGSDHCAVKLFIQSEALNKKPGPGFWKFNCWLLENEAYINELKENIKAYRNKYDYLEDKGLKWDLLKMEM